MIATRSRSPTTWLDLTWLDLTWHSYRKPGGSLTLKFFVDSSPRKRCFHRIYAFCDIKTKAVGGELCVPLLLYRYLTKLGSIRIQGVLSKKRRQEEYRTVSTSSSEIPTIHDPWWDTSFWCSRASAVQNWYDSTTTTTRRWTDRQIQRGDQDQKATIPERCNNREKFNY